MQQLMVEYFHFEQNFMEDNLRCIPMIVRFKLDACGIKLKLKEWNKMTIDEREQLALLPIDSAADLDVYRAYLQRIVYNHTGESVTLLPTNNGHNNWPSVDALPLVLKEKLEEYK